MEHRFSIPSILSAYLGSKGIFYPGVFLNKMEADGRSASKYEMQTASTPILETNGAIPLRIADVLGRYYFMPVWIYLGSKKTEIPNAVISMTGRKNIVETQLIGVQGSVKELVSIADYEISLISTVVGQSPDSYPEEAVRELVDLYNKNEAVEIVSGITDIVLGADSHVVIKSISFPAVGGYENQQIVEMSLVTDRLLELEEV